MKHNGTAKCEFVFKSSRGSVWASATQPLRQSEFSDWFRLRALWYRTHHGWMQSCGKPGQTSVKEVMP